MDIQRLRNLTTKKLHTDMDHIYEDLEWITGEPGIMTHMLPRVLRCVTPWLKRKVDDPRFWNGEYDTEHVGEYELPEPTRMDRYEMLQRFEKMANPLEGKTVIPVFVDE